MRLGELIEFLKGVDPAKVCRFGLKNPHSYRGYYEDLAFEPAENVTVGEMLAAAEYALGETFTGYKGGEYVMGEHTDCWLANYGDGGGEGIGPMLLQYMTSDAESSLAAMRQRADGAEARALEYAKNADAAISRAERAEEALRYLYNLHARGVFSLPDEHYAAITNAAEVLSSPPADASKMGGEMEQRLADALNSLSIKLNNLTAKFELQRNVNFTGGAVASSLRDLCEEIKDL